MTACQDPRGTPYGTPHGTQVPTVSALGPFGAAVPFALSSREQNLHQLPGNSRCQCLLSPPLGWKTSSDSSVTHKFQHVVRHITSPSECYRAPCDAELTFCSGKYSCTDVGQKAVGALNCEGWRTKLSPAPVCLEQQGREASFTVMMLVILMNLDSFPAGVHLLSDGAAAFGGDWVSTEVLHPLEQPITSVPWDCSAEHAVPKGFHR